MYEVHTRQTEDKKAVQVWMIEMERGISDSLWFKDSTLIGSSMFPRIESSLL